MRVRPILAAVLALGLSAPAALADQPAEPAAVATVDFQQASENFEQTMSRLIVELSAPANRARTREVAARYQADADAFADLIEARQAAGLPTPGKLGRAAQVRRLPNELRLTVADRQQAALFPAPRQMDRTPNQYVRSGVTFSRQAPF